MSKPKKPKTPKHEIEQQKTAAAMFAHGSGIKGRVGDAFLSDIRARGKGSGVGSAAAAADTAIGLAASRKEQSRTASSYIKNASDGISGKLQGLAGDISSGLTRDTNVAREAQESTRAAGRLVSTAGAIASIEGIKSAADYNARNMASKAQMDTVASMAGAYATRVDNKKTEAYEAKIRKEQQDDWDRRYGVKP